MVFRGPVGRFAFGALGFGVDGSGIEVRNVVEEFVFDARARVGGLGQREVRRDADSEVGLESVSFPADLDLTHGLRHPVRRGCFLLDSVDERGDRRRS